MREAKKKLFRIQGLAMWMDATDQKTFIKIKEYVWAENERRAKNLIRFRIARFIEKQLKLNFLPKVHLDYCTTEVVKIPS